MYRYHKTPTDDSPSFSSSLLDQIYRSIDDPHRKSTETKFYRETTRKETNNVRQEKAEVREFRNRKSHHCYSDQEQDALFFSSTSISSDSSSGGFSSSDTESAYGTRSRASSFAPQKPRPVRTSASFRWEDKHGTTRNLFDGFCRNPNNVKQGRTRDDETLIKSKSRALKIYNNLKKVKQPISPGGRLSSFLNSLFQTGNPKKKNSGSCEDANAERKAQVYTCSSASSFSRSCLSKTSSSDRDLLYNGMKRTVRFLEEDELKFPAPVDETSRGFLREYQKKKNDLVLKNLPIRSKFNEEEVEDENDDDDAASYASSDLFELDHLAVFGNDRYCEELPVYETTHVSTNRAIASGLIA